MTFDRKHPLFLILAIVAMGCILVASGCTHNQTMLDDAGQVKLITSPANAARVTRDGDLTASYLGSGASVTNVDSGGQYSVTPGPTSTAHVTDGTNSCLIVTNGNCTVERVRLGPIGGRAPQPTDENGEPIPLEDLAGGEQFEALVYTVEIKKLGINVAEPISAGMPGLLAAFEALEGMTQIQAEAWVEQMRIAGEIPETLAEVLLKYFVPTLPTLPG